MANSKGKTLASAKSKMMRETTLVNAIDKSVGDDVDVDIEKPPFPKTHTMPKVNK